jgi:hypothetical protein
MNGRPPHFPAAAAAAALALALTFPSPARAQAPDLGWRTTATLFGQVNPRSLAADVRLRHRQALYDDERPLLALNHLETSAGLTVSPAGLIPSIGVEVQPLSVLTLGVAYAPAFYFGTSGLAQSYPSPRARLGGTALGGIRGGPGGSYALGVHQLVLSGALQARVKAVALRAALSVTRLQADLHGDDRVVYDPLHDLLVYRSGWVAQGDTDLVWFASPRLVLGVRHSLVTAWYPAAAFPASEPRLRSRTTSRLGPLARYALWKGHGGLADEGSVVAAAQWWLAHPDRTGRTSPAAVPLAFVALQVSGGP